jgi:uncharacterized protein
LSARRFETDVLTNPNIATLLEHSDDLPQACLAGGCLFQTVWNRLHGFEPTFGILDYDLFYFDAHDTTAAAERAMAERIATRFAALNVNIEVTNQARVHLWFEQEFGVPSAPFHSCEDGIDAFLAKACCVGMRRGNSAWTIYAPHGFDDIYGLVVRSNPRRAAQGEGLREAYDRKTARWQSVWPLLKVLPWSP